MRFPTITLLALCVAVGAAQQVREFRAELGAEFGSVPGRVVIAGDRLIFLDETQPDGSFYVDLADVQEMSPAGDVVTLQMRNPVKDRSGSRTRVAFRTLGDTDRSALANWYTNKTAAAGTSGTRTRVEGTDAANTYTARRNKFMGGSRGRLVIRDDRLAYESINDVKDSREWMLTDIREVRQKSPYEIEIVPFSGDKYKLDLEGQGMANEEYQRLVDRIAQARSNR